MKLTSSSQLMHASKRLTVSISAMLLILLNGCSNYTKINKAHNSNMQNFDKFSRYRPERLIKSSAVKKVPSLEPHSTEAAKCKRKNLKVSQIRLGALAELLSKVYGIKVGSTSVHLDEGLTISFDYQDVSLEYILEDLVEKYNVGYDKTAEGYVIYPPQIRTKMFSLSYHSFQRTATSSVAINSSISQGVNVGGSNSNNTQSGQGSSSIQTVMEETFWTNVMSSIDVIIQDDKGIQEAQIFGSGYNGSSLKSSSISIDKDNGIIVVRAFPRALRNVGRFIDAIKHNCLKQVVIEAKILEVALSDEFNTGIDWSALPNSNLQFNSDASDIKSSVGLVSGVFRHEFSLSEDVFKAAIGLLSSQGAVSVLSSPKISALNNQRAIIKFGSDELFITNASTTSTNTSTGANNQTTGFSSQTYFSGIALDATPTITPQEDIVMHIHPVISRVTKEEQEFVLNDQKSKLTFPKVASREADTIVKARSGDIIIIGGLSDSIAELDQTGPSVRGNIIGLLGKQRKSSVKRELIILLRPVIVDSYDNYEKIDVKQYLVKERIGGF